MVTINLKGGRVQIFGNNLKESKFYSGRNLEYIEFRECLLSFGVKSFVVQFAVKEYKDGDIQNYNFAFVLYGCETWSLISREARRTRVFENRMLRRIIFGPKRDEVTEEWRKLHNEELNDLYSLPNIIKVIKLRRVRWAGHAAHTMERRGVYRILVGKPEGRRQLGRLRHI